jgi:hypothetical protein
MLGGAGDSRAAVAAPGPLQPPAVVSLPALGGCFTWRPGRAVEPRASQVSAAELRAGQVGMAEPRAALSLLVFPLSPYW